MPNPADIAKALQRQQQVASMSMLPEGMTSMGNIQTQGRPQVKNSDGSISTVRSIGVNVNGEEVLIPTVVGGRVVSNNEAVDHYRKTGEHLGKFSTPDASSAYAQSLHEAEAKRIKK
jgi:hypothetical protein